MKRWFGVCQPGRGEGKLFRVVDDEKRPVYRPVGPSRCGGSRALDAFEKGEGGDEELNKGRTLTGVSLLQMEERREAAA